jgi:hypothetical protein
MADHIGRQLVNGQDHLPGRSSDSPARPARSSTSARRIYSAPESNARSRSGGAPPPAVSLTGQLPAICGGNVRIWQAGHRR